MAKKIEELTFMDDYRYTDDHEWLKVDGDKAKVGISDYAQDQLGEIVFVELPEVGDEFEKGGEFGTVESTKAVSELYMPVGGKIVAVNNALEDSPELVTNEPYAGGWIVEIEIADTSEIQSLMDKDAYLEMLKGL
jgi:glycine cleavage system H protein